MSRTTSGDFDNWSQLPCKRETQSFGGPPSPSQPSGLELVAAFGRDRELVYCGGDAALNALGWTSEPRRVRMTYEPGEREIITHCPETDPKLAIDAGTVRLAIGGAEAVVSVAYLHANLRSPQVVHLYGDDFSARCDLQLTAWVQDGMAEACFSVSGPKGQPLYASFRSRCE